MNFKSRCTWIFFFGQFIRPLGYFHALAIFIHDTGFFSPSLSHPPCHSSVPEGLGEPDVNCLRRIHDHYSKVAPRALAVTFGSAFFAQIGGNFDEAITHYEEFVTGQSIVKTFHNLSYWQQIWLYA